MTITINEAEDWQVCQDCHTQAQPNNHVRTYSHSFFVWGPTQVLCSRCRNRDYGQCTECAVLVHTSTLVDGYCIDHRYECHECETRVSNLVDGYCDECTWYCEGCNESHPNSMNSYYSERRDASYCGNTRPRGDGEGIREYGRTRPAAWFGGPLPRDESNRRVGYYLGFELEIGTDNMTGEPIHEWAEDHGMRDFFDCKEDSSVEGFEIATQPFTPAFFEQMVTDGRLASFFEMLNDNYPLDGHRGGQENSHHGLHVHVGKVAFEQDSVALAAFSYVLAQDGGKHLERIARRDPTTYCQRVNKPVGQAIVSTKGTSTPQGSRIFRDGIYPGRGAINLSNGSTVEVRAFRSTRSADELADAVRLVYAAADYVRYLRRDKTHGVDPKALGWAEFCRWVAFSHPEAFPSLAGLDKPKVRRAPRVVSEPLNSAFSLLDFTEEVHLPDATVETEWEQIDESGCNNMACCPRNFRQVSMIRPHRGLGLAAI